MRKLKTSLLFAACAMAFTTAWANDVDVKTFRYAGPFDLPAPVLIDSTDAQQKSFASESLLNTPLHLSLAQQGRIVNAGNMPTSSAPYALHLLQFNIQNAAYRKVGIELKGLKHYQVYVDNKLVSPSDVVLQPQTHNVVIKYLSQKDSTYNLSVKLTNVGDNLTTNTNTRRTLTLSDIQNGLQYYRIGLSANGRYLITNYYDVMDGGYTRYSWRLTDLKTGTIMRETDESMSWIPETNRFYTIRKGREGRDVIATDPLTGREQTLVTGIGEGNITLAPNGEYLILSTSQEGPKEDADIYEITQPEDRQPGWRTRWNLSLVDLKTGLTRPLTFGYHNVSLEDISADGRYILYMVSRSRLEKRPTTVSSLYKLDVKTMQSTCVAHDEGFLSEARFSPDASVLLVKATAEAFNDVGKNVPEGSTPNMYDYQLFALNVSNKAVTPLTKTFNPSIENFSWNPRDGQIYFTALDKDQQKLFRLNPKTNKFTRLDMPEDYVTRVSFAHNAPLAVWYGESASNSDRLYTLNLDNGKSSLLEDLSKLKLKDIDLGTCTPWNFVSSRGDTISGRCYLPPHFDPNKKYPMIVNYYGGCSPVSVYFESRYPLHLYAAQGYVVYLVNPSGAAGFGQTHASRHVNTAGKGVAEDIIEGTKAFLKAHPYVDPKRVGCIGASYGGFMTQYLQTQTDIFAAAISHAGISDHTSYWGEGYWGYSYSEVSMANSYPWTRKDLYVDQSPLYNADKIHTPLLFLHGNADTNVPIGESIQMFTALKLLGRPTAFVVVNGENHTIMDYQKRIKWQNTIFAWFARYLQNNPSWWQALYPEKKL